MSSTRSIRLDQRLWVWVSVATHRARHGLTRRVSTLSPGLETPNVKIVSTDRFGRRLPREVVVTHGTLGRHFWWWWKQLSALGVSPAQRVLLVLGASTLRSVRENLGTPLVRTRESTRCGILRMNLTRRTPEGAFVLAGRSGACHARTRGAYRRRRSRRTRVRVMWYESMNPKDRCDRRIQIQIGGVDRNDRIEETFDERRHCLIRRANFYVM